jgi:hypothetical protein
VHAISSTTTSKVYQAFVHRLWTAYWFQTGYLKMGFEAKSSPDCRQLPYLDPKHYSRRFTFWEAPWRTMGAYVALLFCCARRAAVTAAQWKAASKAFFPSNSKFSARLISAQ